MFNRPGYDTLNAAYIELINELNQRENDIKDITYESDDFLNKHILILEIKETICRLKKGKATGLDQIPNEVLMCDKLHDFCLICANCLICALTIVFPHLAGRKVSLAPYLNKKVL